MEAKFPMAGLGILIAIFISSSSFAYIAEDTVATPVVESLARWMPPVKVSIPITSCFGPRVLLGKFQDFHEGVDFGAKLRTPVKAVASGKVVWQGFEGCSGRTVVIEHAPLKDGKIIFSLYRHLKNFSARRGQHVRAGQIIAHSGASGKRLNLEQSQQSRGCIMGPHLHLEFVVLNDGVKKEDFEKTLIHTSGHLADLVSYMDPSLFLNSVRQECSEAFMSAEPLSRQLIQTKYKSSSMHSENQKVLVDKTQI